MKNLLIYLPVALFITACGSESGDALAPSATPASQTPSPSPIVNACAEVPFLGSWQAANDLQFKDDCSATSGDQKLSWSLDANKFIQFKQDKIDIDSCSFQIITEGGLAAPLSITLKLNCEKAGLLSYKKK